MEYFRKYLYSLYLRGSKSCNGNAVSVAVQLHYTTVRMRRRAEGQRVRDQQATPDTIMAVTERSTRTKTQQYPCLTLCTADSPHIALSCAERSHHQRFTRQYLLR